MRIVSDDLLLLDELYGDLKNSGLQIEKKELNKEAKGSLFELLTNPDFLETLKVLIEYLYKGFEIYIGYKITINGKTEEVEKPIDKEVIQSEKDEDKKLLEDLSKKDDVKIIIKRS